VCSVTKLKNIYNIKKYTLNTVSVHIKTEFVKRYFEFDKDYEQFFYNSNSIR